MNEPRPYDLIVVGFGAAGACAAIEAAEHGARVLVIDRFTGGGATAISGGVVYAGGETHIQKQAGVEDSIDALYAYLKQETQGVVGDETLKRFCDQSRDNLRWLEDHGVPFSARLCPTKTSYPSNDYFLYYSGNEAFRPYCDEATPAPRGHRAVGKGLPGANFFHPLKAAARDAGADIWCHTRAQALVVENQRVVGLEVHRLMPGWRAWLHGALERLALRINPYQPRWARRLRRFGDRWHRKHAVRETLRSQAVALTTGGFIYNRKRVRSEAPNYAKGMPLGTIGCDGSGIAMAEAIGAATDHMSRISAWRFINPPLAFAKGILVNRMGERYINEACYGAAIGEAMVDHAQGTGILILDAEQARQARRQVGRGKTHWFQTAPALLNLWFNSRKANSIEALAEQLGMEPQVLEQTVTLYNTADDDPLGKPRAFRSPINRPPFRAIDCSIGSKIFPLPTLTLGGLVVDEASGAVQRPDGSTIEGLYAAGRAAVGICSRQYVSGLSLADCVFSGRRIGAAFTTAKE